MCVCVSVRLCVCVCAIVFILLIPSCISFHFYAFSPLWFSPFYKYEMHSRIVKIHFVCGIQIISGGSMTQNMMYYLTPLLDDLR
jgi:hypothetical protein